MTNTIKYQSRVVFFFDILGFRDLIETNQQEKGEDCSTIFNVFNFIYNFYQDEIDDKYSETKQITFFSDSVIISFVEDEPDQVFNTIADIQILLVNLVLKGVVMRGAISYGQLFHDEKFLFGPAFVEAYLIETKKAQYPRIICESSIIVLSQKGKQLDDAKQDLETFYEIVKPDNDEFWYIDYFEGIESLFDDSIAHIDYLLTLRDLIVNNINKAATDDIKQKYLWMKDKFNETVQQIFDNKKSGRFSDYLIVRYVEQLKLIEEQ